MDGEDILNEAEAFALGHLKDEGSMDPVLSELVVHALEFPLHYRVTRLEARWYIDAYTRRDDRNAMLLELAKLDYNMVQAAHQIDMINISRWWKNLDLPKQLPFVARDRLVECFLWTSGVVPEPQYKMSREVVTKLTTLVTVIDDVYDIYATLDEVKLFTDAIERLQLYLSLIKMHAISNSNTFHCIEFKVKFSTMYRWDVSAVEQLPDYMKLCYMAIFNTTNEIGYDILKEQNFNAETERGDVLKSVQCYMHNNGVTEDVAREYIRKLADEAWKKMNAELWVDSPLPEALVKVVINFTRTSEIMYQYGDGHGIQDFETKDLVLGALVDTLPII
ncbi:hypothetical protein AQUCO_02800275v1 [Aquilegia coerulea]|uniref:Terpene synthase metal-binding domain-containing protein n=1 Tax=Aquilegia coerulea TaxID=218851 RepID=A0A2G5D4L7_AQUCA|nr:hypothetical protein AQUCO_02800275v1 [Aquilegia coerulea]